MYFKIVMFHMKLLVTVYRNHICTSPSQAAKLKRKFSVAGVIFLSRKTSIVMYCLSSSPFTVKDFKLFINSLVLEAISC